ncbi:MAG: class I SAM-dependent methyltransferase [Chitinophagaceae bacterium]
MKELSWTGERLVTSVTDIHGVIEHLHRYALAMELTKGLRVLDIASGEGYGSNLISTVAAHVTGVDISAQSVQHANEKYQHSSLIFKEGSTSKIPLEDNSVDIVVSFETLEHHDEHQQMMNEIKRVLVPNGVLLLSSPERSIYKSRDPENPYHIKELTLNELKSLLGSSFKNVQIYDQRFVFGSLINSHDKTDGIQFYDGDYSRISKTLDEDIFYNRPFFNLAIASDGDIPAAMPGTSLFNGVKVLRGELKQMENLRKSTSYRLGNFFVQPFAILKKKLSGQ